MTAQRAGANRVRPPLPERRSTSICPALRTVWVSFDVIGLDCLEAAAASGAEVVGVVTLPGPVDPNRSGQCSFDDVAARLGAELIEAADINAPEVVAAVGALEPEVIFVVGWSQLVRDAFIATASRAVYGMHPTLLPRHRGRAPIPWAILSGLAKTGVTLFEITDPTADSGPIVGQVEVPIARDETATTLYDRLAEAHVSLVRDAVPRIVARIRAAHPAGPQARELVAQADAARRDHRLGDPRALPLRLGPRPDPSVPGSVHVARRREGRGLARSPRRGRERGAGRDDRRAASPTGLVVACGDGALLLEEVETSGELEVGAVLG